jgi:2,4-dienoyl-CoA reductase-like NADH-dependent reductase (Old Yellow Enzyme family)
MSLLFSPLTLRSITLSNRIVVSPMCQYSAEEGVANDWHLMHLGKFAVSGVGMVIVEATGVEMAGRITPHCLALCNDQQEAALTRIVQFCKSHGPARMAIQLGHAGRKGSTRRPWDSGPALNSTNGGWLVDAPSALPYSNDGEVPHALTPDDLTRISNAFVNSAQRALRAGFEGAELHGAHGYLLHQFLSPLTNQRTDVYGGSLENRLRYPLEVFKAVRAIWPEHLPLGIRLSAIDWAPGGLSIEDTLFNAAAFKAAGADWIDVSSGGLVAHQKITVGPGYQVPFAAQVKRTTDATTMTVGMITDAHQAEAILQHGDADLIALARAMLRDPHWAWHAADALGETAAVVPQYVRAR